MQNPTINYSQSATSIEAAVIANTMRSKAQKKILEYLINAAPQYDEFLNDFRDGLTCRELELKTGLSHSTCSSALVPLKASGIVYECGRTKHGRTWHYILRYSRNPVPLHKESRRMTDQEQTELEQLRAANALLTKRCTALEIEVAALKGGITPTQLLNRIDKAVMRTRLNDKARQEAMFAKSEIQQEFVS